jgi:hypothetical protein
MLPVIEPNLSLSIAVTLPFSEGTVVWTTDAHKAVCWVQRVEKVLHCFEVTANGLGYKIAVA